ncbi:MAG: hypothetical protein ACKOXO_10725, partial [Cyanobium sp.]
MKPPETIQTLRVSSRRNVAPIGQPRVYTQPLTKGQIYQIEVKGSWRPDTAIDGWFVDARFVTHDSFASISDQDSNYGDFGLYSDALGLANDDFWGGYKPSHGYTITYTGEGSPVDFYVYDIDYADNAGAYVITVKPETCKARIGYKKEVKGRLTKRDHDIITGLLCKYAFRGGSQRGVGMYPYSAAHRVWDGGHGSLARSPAALTRKSESDWA